MIVRALPWVLAAVFGTVSVILLVRGAGAKPTATAPAPAAVPAFEPNVLGQCTTRLESVEQRLARCKEERAVAAPSRGRPACLEDPATAAYVEAAMEAEIAARAEGARARRLEQRAGMRRSVEKFLDISPEQSRWLIEYVCAVRGLRGDVMEDLSAGTIDLEAAAARQKAERADALADLEKLLGAEKYGQLREVGGLGMLGELFCE